ncbi:MAG: 2-oxo acid dehydrogenase subunit E2 [Dehalococcoidales bacterium]|nr:2-oxo acid dehydrogenase subunit E2 [Dehalococcoidales bacterium]
MATELIVPKLGMSTEPINLVEWKAKEGDRVEKGSVVLVVETEKISHDVEAEASGFLHILLEAGQEAPIGSAAALIVETEDELKALQKGGGGEKAAGEVTESAPQAEKTASVGPPVGTPVIVPKLGMSTEPVNLVEWKVKEGDRVEKGSVVLVVETEKISHDVEAEASGFLHILLEAGREAPIGSTAGLIVASEAELAAVAKGGVVEEASVAKAALAVAEEERVAISPVARRMAEEHMIDIAGVSGSGPEGKIVKEDIEREIAKKKEAPAAPAEAAAVDYQGRKVKAKLPLTGMRKAIAEHMHRSLSVAAQLTVMGELDVAELVKARKKLVEQEKKLGARITYTDLMVAAVAKLLRDYPQVNASLMGNEIIQWQDINVSVAVALDEGLIVPVVRHADRKSLVEISKEVRSLAKRAREGALAPEDVQGGTFTITNLGAMGGGYRFETVIINQPEAAILGTGGIADRAVVREGKIVASPIMTYYLTYDHRVFTGAVAAAFINSLAELLKTPDSFIKVK